MFQGSINRNMKSAGVHTGVKLRRKFLMEVCQRWPSKFALRCICASVDPNKNRNPNYELIVCLQALNG
jgi:hypothetical protein